MALTVYDTQGRPKKSVMPVAADLNYVRASMAGNVTAGAFAYPTYTLVERSGDPAAFTLNVAGNPGGAIVVRDAGLYLVTARPGSPSGGTRWYSQIWWGPVSAMTPLPALDTSGLPSGGGIGVVFTTAAVVRLAAGEGVCIQVYSTVGGAYGGAVEVTRLSGVQGPPGPAAPVVSALPVAPYDGQEVHLRVDVAGTYGGPYLWHCRYNAALAGASKWEVVAGAALRVEGIGGRNWNAAGETSASLSYAPLPTPGPTIAIPVAGVYEMEGKSVIAAAAGGSLGGILMGVSGEGVPTWDGGDAVLVPYNTGYGGTVFGRRTRAIAAGLSVSLLYASSGAGSPMKFYDRALYLRPIRLG